MPSSPTSHCFAPPSSAPRCSREVRESKARRILTASSQVHINVGGGVTTCANTMTTSQRQPTAAQHLLAGGLGGLIADATVHPLLTVKARMQVAGATGAFNYTSTSHALRSILQSEGVAGLYKGASAIVWATPACGLYFLGYTLGRCVRRRCGEMYLR